MTDEKNESLLESLHGLRNEMGDAAFEKWVCKTIHDVMESELSDFLKDAEDTGGVVIVIYVATACVILLSTLLCCF